MGVKMKIDTVKTIEQQMPLSDTSAKAKGKRLKIARELTYLGLTAFAKKHDFNYGTLKSWEFGLHGGLPPKRVFDVLRSLQMEGIVCSYEWLVYGIGEEPYRSRISFVDRFSYDRVVPERDDETSIVVDPQVRTAPAKYENEAAAIKQQGNSNQGISEEQRIAEELEDFCRYYQDVAFLVVDDDALYPIFQHGDLIAGVKYYGKDMRKVANQDCIVQVVGEYGSEQLLRNVIYSGATKDKYTLVCKNHHATVAKPVLYEVQLISAAPVVWLRRKVNKKLVLPPRRA